MKNTTLGTHFRRSSMASVLLLTLFSTSSMFALAATPDKRLAGELIVAGTSANTDAAVVMVDGERAMSGRSVFSSSTITTSANAGATVSLGNAGRIELAPNTQLNLNFTDKTISGTIAAGQVKVFSSAGVEARIQTKDDTIVGDVNQNNLFAVDVRSGTTNAVAEMGAIYSSNGKKLVQQDADKDSDLSSKNVIVPLAIFAGIVAVAVIYVVTNNDNNNEVIASPVR
ncbi:MAG: hypothetical protein ABI954_07780 [Pyrinomonadaceae bacterium]